jgi:hypothetical protein
MFPNIPDSLDELNASDLRALAGEIRSAVEEVLNSSPDAETLQQAQDFVAKRKEILDLAKIKESLASAVAEMQDEDEQPAEDFEAEVAEVVEVDEPEAEAEKAEVDGETEEVAEEDTEASDTAGESDIQSGPAAETTEASVAPKVRTSMGVDTAPEVSVSDVTPDKLLARSGVAGKGAGDQFDSWNELAVALSEKAGQIGAHTNEKFQVAYIPGNFDASHQLGENMVTNLRKFEPEILAEMCAPPEPQYDLACWNTDRRPVRNSMAAFKPDARGAVSIYPSPSLADITDQAPDGVGIWDNDRDTDLDDPKTCAVIECAEPSIYRLYGVYRCLTVQNLLAITFPELVEAYLNRLAAAHARLAEQQLLEAMGAASVNVQADPLGYGTTTSVTSTVLNLLALHQETERWDNGPMEAWMPRWIAWAMKMDLVRRRNTSGSVIDVPSDGEITRLFNSVGVTPHFFIDTPTWATAVPAVQTQGTLNLLPNSVQMVVAPQGKFAVMDRGELSIGVTGNNIYRDNASNSLNQFTFFFENFEALVDTNSCPAYLLDVQGLCHNGVQIDDAIIDCDGAGEGS